MPYKKITDKIPSSDQLFMDSVHAMWEISQQNQPIGWKEVYRQLIKNGLNPEINYQNFYYYLQALDREQKTILDSLMSYLQAKLGRLNSKKTPV